MDTIHRLIFFSILYYTFAYFHIIADSIILLQRRKEKDGRYGSFSFYVVGARVINSFLHVFFYVFHQVSHVEFDFYPYAVLTFVEVYVLNISTFYKTKLKIRRKARPFAVFSIVACLITTILTLLLVVYYKYGAVGKLWAALIASSIVAVYSIAHSLNKWEIDRQILKKRFEIYMAISPRFFSMVFHFRY
mgnify:CR=1 FL=1